jgi:hypothetical protein
MEGYSHRPPHATRLPSIVIVPNDPHERQSFSVTNRILENIQLEMLSGTLYRVALVPTDVSENISPLSSGILRVIGFHSCVMVETLLISLIPENYLWSKIIDSSLGCCHGGIVYL